MPTASDDASLNQVISLQNNNSTIIIQYISNNIDYLKKLY